MSIFSKELTHDVGKKFKIFWHVLFHKAGLDIPQSGQDFNTRPQISESTYNSIPCASTNHSSRIIACQNSRFPSLLVTGGVSPGQTSASQRQKFHTDDVNQCVHNHSGGHGVPSANLSDFRFVQVGFCKVCVRLRTSSSKTEILILEKRIVVEYTLPWNKKIYSLSI